MMKNQSEVPLLKLKMSKTLDTFGKYAVIMSTEEARMAETIATGHMLRKTCDSYS